MDILMQTEIDDGRSHTQQSDDEDARPGPADCRVRHKEKERKREREREDVFQQNQPTLSCPVLSLPPLREGQQEEEKEKGFDVRWGGKTSTLQ
jgi:hypothetical protein